MTQTNKKHRALIVGGGFGGVKAALGLAKDHRFDVTLISDKQDFRYYPSLYHTATGGSRAVSDIPLNEIFAESPSVEVVNATVKSLDKKEKYALTTDGRKFEYDVAVLGLGMVTNFFGIPGLENLAYGIKSVEDAEELKKHLHKQITETKHPDLNYVVVGGGPTGVELAGVLGDYIEHICKNHGVKKRSVHVDLVEAADRLLPRSPKSVSKKVKRQLKRQGVRIYLKAAVKSQDQDEILVNDKPIRSHTVIWTAGMAINPFLNEQNFQMAANRKVRVDQFLQAEPGIYVIGDNADTPYSGMAQTALYDGAYVAKNLIRLADNEPPVPYTAKEPIYVMPAGPHWAAVMWGKLRFYGWLGWSMRRAADFVAYRDYEPFFKATKHWMSEYVGEDLCPYCDKE